MKRAERMPLRELRKDGIHLLLPSPKRRRPGSGSRWSGKFSALRTLIAAASDREDIAPLARIIGDNDLKMVATQARKAIAEIDYVLYGPQAVKKAK